MARKFNRAVLPPTSTWDIFFPRWPYQGSPNTTALQKHRDICWKVFFYSILIGASSHIAVKYLIDAKHNITLAFLLLVLFNLAARAIVMSVQYMLELNESFYLLNLAKLADRLRKEDIEQNLTSVKIDLFLFAPDLRELENSLKLDILGRIKAVREHKRALMSENEKAKLQKAHSELDNEIMKTAEKTGTSYKARRILSQNLSLSRKRSFFMELSRFAVLGSKGLGGDKDDDKLQKYVDYLIEISGGQPSSEAMRLHALAKQESDIKKREQYLKEAIEAERQTKSKTVVAVEPMPISVPKKPTKQVDQLPLWQYAREQFSIVDLLPSEIDAVMATTILLLLIGPGNRARRFQAKYWPEATLRREVVHHYERILKSGFQPKVFSDTLKWLYDEGVLSSKPKPNGQMYGLSAVSSKGKSAESQEIIRKVVNATELFKN